MPGSSWNVVPVLDSRVRPLRTRTLKSASLDLHPASAWPWQVIEPSLHL